MAVSTTTQERQEALIEDYLYIEEPSERFQLIVEAGTTSPRLSSDELKDEFLVPGCVSRVWLLVRQAADQTLTVLIESESPALQGIGQLYGRVYSGSTAEEILAVEPDFIERLAIDRFLTPTRRRGLRNLRLVMKERATSYLEGGSAEA